MNTQPVLLALIVSFCLGVLAGVAAIWSWAQYRTHWVHDRRWAVQ